MAQWVVRSVCGVLLVLLAGSHVLPALHFGLEPHLVCADHGELTHGSEAAAPDRQRTRYGDELSSEHADDEHDHCTQQATSATSALFASRAAPERAFCDGANATAVGERVSAHTSIALLAYAPKLAPPA